MSLRLEHVTKLYGGRPVIRDVSMNLSKGEVVLLIGANGAGKSTLLRVAAGLSRPSSGTVTHDHAEIGYLGHATGIYPGLTALENLQFWQSLRHGKSDQSFLMSMLERVGLAKRAQDRVEGFSRGMSQRLNLARLLAEEPDILLLDEPGTGLDAAASRLLVSEIQAARNRGAGIVWVSHDVDRDLALADRLVELGPWRDAKGKQRHGSHIVYDGPVAQYPALPSESDASRQQDRGGEIC